MKHRDEIVIKKIISEINTGIKIFDNISYENFVENETIKRAVCMTAINVGELMKIISDEVRLKHKEIPWKAITGFRDVAAHKYEALNIKDVYVTVSEDFPVLKEQLQKILNENR